MSKMSALVLPAILLLTDWKFEAGISKKRWLEKIPFAVILLLYGISSLNNVQAFSKQYPDNQYPVMAKNSLYIIPFYLQKTIWPSRLSAHYPTDMRFFMPQLWFSILLSLGLIGGSFLLLNKFRREWVWGWGFFLIALLQVFGLVWHFFPVANRYSYLPAIGLSFILVMAVSQAGKKLNKWNKIRLLRTFVIVATLIFLSATSFLRCRVWKDSISLWNDVIEKYPMIPLAYHNRASALKASGRLDEALADYSRAIWLMPHSSFYWNRGLAWQQNKQTEKAAEDFYEAARLDKEYFRMFSRMAVETQGSSGYAQIINMGERLLANRPDAQVHVKMAEALIHIRHWQEAEFHLQEAVRLSPNEKEYRHALQVFREALQQHLRRSEGK